MAGKIACVVGANGYVASWIVAELLDRGYKVHGTVRNPDDEQRCGHLKNLPGAKERLSLFKVDLLECDTLVKAFHGCDVVFHTACPVAMEFEDPDAVLKPAMDGTRNVMLACDKLKIKHVIFTSSAAAMVGDPKRPKDRILDEDCWSDPEYCRENQHWYMLAKTESEKLAGKLANEFGIHLVCICPGFVIGPLLQSTVNSSVEIVSSLINGSKTTYPNRYYRIVDVRDVAKAHVAGFEDTNASGRYLCVATTQHCKDIIQLLRKNFPQYSYSDKREGETTEADKVSNKKVLSLIREFIPFEKSLIDTVFSLQEKGLIPVKES